MEFIIIALVALVALGIGFLLSNFITKKGSNSKINEANSKVESAQEQAKAIIASAERDAESKKKESILAAKEEVLKLTQQQEAEERVRTKELRELENRVNVREEKLDAKEEHLDEKVRQLSGLQSALDKKQNEVESIIARQTSELERVANLTQDEAKDELLGMVKKQVVAEEAKILRDSEARTKQEADKTARKILSVAIQRCTTDEVSEMTVTTVHIPSDEMKGRIIGREGRNIRAFEAISGVSLVIDDTPETVVLTCYEPVRREIARVALESLIADGRIHPARIEEMYKKAEKTVNERIVEAGSQAAFDMGIHDLDPELIKTLGALKYRTSYGQNMLSHSKQVAEFAALLAAEIGFDEQLAKRAGFLHDIGKAVDRTVEGPHAVIGADLARKYGERPEIIHAIEAHHEDVEPTSVLDVLVQAADAISGARPGARRESAEAYIKRLEKLEEISNAHDGVERTYAMQAGREVHVMVEPQKISDNEAVVLAHDIASQIEAETVYPGQVKVVVIRESRAVDIAK